MKNRWTTSASFAAFLIVQAGLAQADEAADSCGSSKMKATAKYAQTVLKCNSKATKNGEPVDSLCISKAGLKLVSAFEKAEAAGGCVTSDDEGSVETSICLPTPSSSRSSPTRTTTRALAPRRR